VVLPLVDTLFTGDSLAARSATYYDAGGKAQPGTATWTTSAPSVATVNAATGVIHAAGPGSAVITATINGKAGPGLVIVTAPLSLTLLLDTIVLLPQDSLVVPALVRRQGGSPPAPWFSTATAGLFTIDSATGRVVGISTSAALPFSVHADSLSVSGSVQVLSPGDTAAGKGGYTVFGSVTADRRATARAENYTRTGGAATFRLALKVAVGNVTVESVNLTALTPVSGPDSIPLDSLSVSEAQGTAFICQPQRSVGLWTLNTSNSTILGVSRPGGWIVIRKVLPVTGGSVISGSFYFVAQRADYYNDPSGQLTVRGDFVAPLITNPTTCH
jgi:hypothetical protein